MARCRFCDRSGVHPLSTCPCGVEVGRVGFDVDEPGGVVEPFGELDSAPVHTGGDVSARSLAGEAGGGVAGRAVDRPPRATPKRWPPTRRPAKR